MFGNIKQGNIVYVLIKGEKPVVKIGQVESVTNPTPKYPTYNPSQPFGTTPEMQIDVKVKCGEEVMEFQKIPTNQELFSYPNAVILSEVESMMQSSRQIVDSVPYHQSVVESCDEILKQLNPQFAKEKQQEEKITALESMVGSLKNDIGDIKNLLLRQSQMSSKTTK